MATTLPTIGKAPTRDEMARRACRTIGDLLATFVTGDPDKDVLAEYMAAGWVRSDSLYAEDDDEEDDRRRELARQLRTLGDALQRMAADVEEERIPLTSLRGVL